MPRFRVSPAAEDDIADILANSELVWGVAARKRYRSLIGAAIRKVAADPHGPATRTRAEIETRLRSLHLRFARAPRLAMKVGKPVHVLYFRVLHGSLIEIVRLLHDRMDPVLHFRNE